MRTIEIGLLKVFSLLFLMKPQCRQHFLLQQNELNTLMFPWESALSLEGMALKWSHNEEIRCNVHCMFITDLKEQKKTFVATGTKNFCLTSNYLINLYFYNLPPQPSNPFLKILSIGIWKICLLKSLGVKT